MITRPGALRAGALLLLVAIATISLSLAQPVVGRAGYALDFDAPLSQQFQVDPTCVCVCVCVCVCTYTHMCKQRVCVHTHTHKHTHTHTHVHTHKHTQVYTHTHIDV